VVCELATWTWSWQCLAGEWMAAGQVSVTDGVQCSASRPVLCRPRLIVASTAAGRLWCFQCLIIVICRRAVIIECQRGRRGARWHRCCSTTLRGLVTINYKPQNDDVARCPLSTRFPHSCMVPVQTGWLKSAELEDEDEIDISDTLFVRGFHAFHMHDGRTIWKQ